MLDARWIRECIKAAALQTFATNWAGCKLDGTETSVLYFETRRVLIIPSSQIQVTPSPRTRARQVEQQQQQQSQQQQQPIQQQTALHIDPQTDYAFVVYIPPILAPPSTPPPPQQPWQATPVVPEQTNMIHRPSEYRKDPAIAWNYYHMPAPPVNPPPPNTTTRDLIATKKMAGRLLRQPAMNPLSVY